ncbi:MAG: arylsulfotransferase family protein [Chitinophagales bacterium]|nr:aryl-sulfate sulfotransferase [Chitinophagales bacterium]MDW8393760.1 arylsulfotransferase family protein [Chitinophagales bacterium]
MRQMVLTGVAFWLASLSALAQYEYVYPKNGSRNEMPQTSIILRHGDPIAQASVSAQHVRLKGNKSGEVPARVVLSTDGVTLCITPVRPFAWNDTVHVSIRKGFRTVYGELLPDTAFSFHVRRQMTAEEEKILDEYLSRYDDGGYLRDDPDRQSTYVPAPAEAGTRGTKLPYVIIFTNTNPAPGYVFFNRNSGSMVIASEQRGYGIIDSNGDSVFHAKSDKDGANFQPNKNGMYTLYRLNKGVDTTVLVMDANFNILYDVPCKNGLRASQHEHLFMPDGSKWFTVYDWQPGWDLSIYGGNPSSIVNVSWIQKLDANNNVTFQWRSDQHFFITDATTDIFNTIGSSTYDPWHINSIFIDNDNNIIAGFRNMDRIVKIKASNGSIIWHWGGKGSTYSDIQNVNDPDGGFSHQHHVQRLPNGNILLFDNGNLHTPPISKPKEYVLDETNLKATCIWFFQHPLVNGFNMYTKNQGSVMRLANGNTFIGYGLPNVQGLPNAVEIDANKNVVWSFRFKDSTEYSYRVYKADLLVGVGAGIPTYEASVFPNPSDGKVTVRLEEPLTGDIQIKLYDRLGRTVYSEQRSQLPAVFDLDLEPAGTGLFLLDMISNQKRWQARLSLQ